MTKKQQLKKECKEKFANNFNNNSVFIDKLLAYDSFWDWVVTKVSWVDAEVKPAQKLIISIENDTVLFDNLNDFKPLEFMGILHNAISTADVLYKTKVMQMVDKAIKSK